MGNDLFLPEYTLGALDTIGIIAKVLGTFTVMVISFVGFGIVNSAIIKNALNGWYWTSPSIWDRVDQVKRAQISLTNGWSGISGAADAANGGIGSNNGIMKLLGTGASLLYSVLPNVKAMSDFGIGENGKEVKTDPKQYFLKAIPLAVIQIFIGVFIYFGYPTQVAEYFSKVGTGVFDLVLDNTDPIAFIEKLPTNFAMYKLSTDTARDDISKVVNSATKKAISAYMGVFDDVQKERRNAVALDIEAWLMQEFTNKAEYCNSDSYKYEVTAQVDNFAIDMDKFNDVTDEDGVYQVAFRVPVDQIESGTAKETAGKYLRVNAIFTPKASKGNTKSVECGITLPSSSGSYNSGTKVLTINLGVSEGSGFGLSALSNVVGKASTDDGSVDVELKVNGTKITVTAKNASLDNVKSITNISGLKYVYGTSSHPIRSINLNGSSGVVFSPIDMESDISSWSWGSSPTKGSSNSGTSSNTNSSTTNDDTEEDNSSNSETINSSGDGLD